MPAPAATRAGALRVTLPGLHPIQREVALHPARFRVLAMGRRWGKTRLGVVLCLEDALRGGTAWWVAPSYKVAKVGWRMLRSVAVQIPGTVLLDGEMEARLPTGGVVAIRSAANPDGLRGEGLTLAVV